MEWSVHSDFPAPAFGLFFFGTGLFTEKTGSSDMRYQAFDNKRVWPSALLSALAAFGQVAPILSPAIFFNVVKEDDLTTRLILTMACNCESETFSPTVISTASPQTILVVLLCD